MALPSFYTPDLIAQSNELRLPDVEAAHAIKSRRLGQGQTVRLFNGKGLVAIAEINQIDRRNVQVTIAELTQHEPVSNRLTIAAAIPKGDRQKVMVDMLTQLGVSDIQPVSCARSITNFNEKLKIKWQRWAIEACKQSQNPWLPTIADQCDLPYLLASSDQLIYTDINGQKLAAIHQQNRNFIALIGPEGGFTEQELQSFVDANLKSVRLAGYILRTETAAISLANQWVLK